MPGKLFGHKHRAVLSARTPEGHHEVFEAAAMICRYARVHERRDAGEKLVNTLFTIQVFDNGFVHSRQTLELLFSTRIRQAAAIEDKPAAVPCIVLRGT